MSISQTDIETQPIAPHGGVMINRMVERDVRDDVLEELPDLKIISIDQRTICDLVCIACGAFSPIQGFMTRHDYESVISSMRLTDGTIWPIPVTLAVEEDAAAGISIGEKIALAGKNGTVYAVLTVTDQFIPDKWREARLVYRTKDIRHPGVKKLMKSPPVYLGGPIDMIQLPESGPCSRYAMKPLQTRMIFAQKGWRTVVAFQTRNPIHRAHEYMQKAALETVDGLLLHPLVGETKADDIPADIRLKSYEILLQNYYPEERVVLAVYPGSMRYAGPREAVLHALVRKNYGCTHFIVGRDHAGVGDYYGTYDAHHIFRQFTKEELGITPIFFEHSFYCYRCGGMASKKTCPHSSENHLILSGTRVREKLRNGEPLPHEFTRPEVSRVLMERMSGEVRETG